MNLLSRREFVWLLAGGPGLVSGALAKKAAGNAVPSYLKGYSDLYRSDPHAAALAWFKNAKFGLFMHYGLYSQLGHGEWVMLREKVPLVQYEKLQSTFNPNRFDADEIVSTAMDAGAKYVNLTSKHHEGFCLFRTRQTSYNSTLSLGRRDLIGELAAACHKKGMGIFLYYSIGADWHHPYFCDPSAGWEFYRPAYAKKPAQYLWTKDADFRIYIEYVHNELRELLTQYGPIAGIWFDPVMGYYARPDLFPLKEIYSMIRSLQPQCLVSFKQGGIGTEDFAAPERRVGKVAATFGSIQPGRRKLASETEARAWASNRSKPLEICDTLQPSAWGYDKRDDGKHRGVKEVASLLKQAWSQNANLLLNTGLLPDGSIPPEDVRTLRALRKAL